MKDWFAWWQIFGSIPVALIGAWIRRRRRSPVRPGIPRVPLVDSIRRIIEANGELIYCESRVRGLRNVIAEMIEVMEAAGVAKEEMRKFRTSQSDSPGATGSPFGSWPDAAIPSPPDSKTTRSSSPSLDANAPNDLTKNPSTP